MSRVDAAWVAVEPLDMQAGTEAAVAVFGTARPHHAYPFANSHVNRMKVSVHDGIGVWLPRRDVRHHPESTSCGCNQGMQRICEDVAEKLDYQPDVVSVERHIRGMWVHGTREAQVLRTLDIRPIAPGRQNWLFAGSLRAGKRAAAVMRLIQSAKLNGLDP